jgi:HlyD family secretion protein
MKKWIKRILIAVVIIVVILGGMRACVYYKLYQRIKGYKTDTVGRGTIKTNVTATGTVTAEHMILVGTQVSGTIKNLYVDFNSPVKAGQLLAEIDPASFEAQVEQSQANLSAARANLIRMDVTYADAKRVWERSQSLFAQNFISRNDLDTAETNYKSADAQVKASHAQVEQAEAALKLAQTNLKNTKILSPVNGIVISRNIDVGQTVAASFQTPTLFSIAKDLTKMQIEASIDEADIGNIKLKQPVEFRVDAYPDMTFKGNVSQIRNAPTTIQNVVTYQIIVKIDNPDYKLKPGMTANVTVDVDAKENVLLVPNTALRFRFPDNDLKAPEQKGQGVWVFTEKRRSKFVNITAGVSDGTNTEVKSGDLKEGDDVIYESETHNKKSASASRGGVGQ